jgi:predicted AlkP superfamily phosphohydrolase/phosphomutase/tetratricopeptide (TPR) repeat protein
LSDAVAMPDAGTTRSRDGRPRLLIVGWDAADWKIAGPLVDRGELPNLKRLIERGVMADLATLQPPLSPMLWNSIATGHRPERHGILGFAEVDPHTEEVRPVSSVSRRCKALWNIATQRGLRVHAVNWYGSHPAEPINGICISDALTGGVEQHGGPPPLAPGAVHPPELADEVAELRLAAEEVDAQLMSLFVPRFREIDLEKDQRPGMIAKIIAETISTHGAAMRALDDNSWDLACVYYIGIDHFCHGFVNFHPPRLNEVPEELFGLYSDVVNSGYRLHDVLLGALLQRVGPETTVILLSDHGFHSDHLRKLETPKVPAGPTTHHRDYGVLVMAGPDVRQDERIYGAGLLDITPTALAVLGLPIGQDMPGRVLAEAFAQPPAVTQIASWEEEPGEAGRHSADVRVAPADSTLLLDQLAAIGYIDRDMIGGADAIKSTRRELDWNLASSLLAAGKPEQAIPLLEPICKDAPERIEFGLALADALSRLGSLDEARLLLEAIVRQRRDTPNGRYLLGRIAAQQGNGEEALVHLRAAAESPMARQPSLHTQIGFAALTVGNVEEADAAFARATGLDAHYAPAWTGRAAAAMRQQRWTDAEAHALQAVALEFNAPMAHLLLGEARLRQGRREEAQIALRLAAQLAPEWIRPRALEAALLRDTEVDADAVAEVNEMYLRRDTRRAEQVAMRPEASQAAVRVLAETYATFVPPSEADATEQAPTELVLVSGLPRSGTSLLMQMLAAGGASILADETRAADADNPEGYLEWSPLNRLPKEPELLHQAEGKVLKLLTPLLGFALPHATGKVVFMERPIREVLLSQLKMRRRSGALDPSDPARLLDALARHRTNSLELLARRGWSVLRVPYGALVAQPELWAARIGEFLGREVVPTPERMAAVVRPELYRNKEASAPAAVKGEAE